MKCILLLLVAVVTVRAAVNLGHVENCKVAVQGSGFIKFSWDFVEGDPDYELHKYSLTTDNDLTTEFKSACQTCSKTVEDLDACIEHTIVLTPVFYNPSGDDISGDPCTIKGYTKDELPGAVSNIQVTSDTDDATSLKWHAPHVNPKCAASYEVCLRIDTQSDQVCKKVNSAEVTMHNISACALYHVYVTPVTQSGMNGTTATDTFNSHDGVPGKPQDVKVGLITKETIQLLWNNPIINPLCVAKYVMTIGETHSKIMKPMKKEDTEYDNEFTFTPLLACTNYTIDVASANAAEITSDKVVRYAATEESYPNAPPTVTVNPSGPHSIDVNWGIDETDKCSGSFEVCWNDGIHPVEECHDVGGDGNNITIDGLTPCTNYDVSVDAHSPSGNFVSNATTNSSFTQDIRPDPVVDLEVTKTNTNYLTIQCLPPENNPQCVKEIVTKVIDEDEKSLKFKRKSQLVLKQSYFEETLTGLKACTNYKVLVSTMSPSGLESEEREVTNRTLDAIPTEPQNFAVTEETTTSVTFQWFQPATNPRCAEKYTLTWIDDKTSDSVIITDADAFMVVYTLEGLEPCTAYNFTLNAVSSVGSSPETRLTQETSC